MWNVTIKGLLAHKLRLFLTGIAIVLGVTFVSGTFVLTDTLHNTFTSLFGNVYQSVDFQVRGAPAFAGNTGANAARKPVPQSLAATVGRVPGVAFAHGVVQGYAQFVAPDGKAVSTGGAPTLGVSFDPNTRLSSLRIVRGTAPTTAHQVAMDEATAQKYHFHLGQSVEVLLSGPTERFTICAFVRFGTADNLAGATLAAFSLPTAQRVLGEVGQYNAIDVLTQPGADKATVQRAIAAVLPRGVQVVTGQTVANQATSAINQALGFFSTALLVFAFIALFVGAFTIFNTFSIIVGQRTRELALLRIVGASRRQVFRAVLGEAFLLGLAASLTGLGLGVLTALGLRALLKGFGISLPSGPLVFAPRTVIVSLLVGVGVTVVSAVSPARRAVRIPPVAAIAEVQAEVGVSSRRRVTVGTVVAAVGVVALAVGLSKPAIQFVGVGAVAIFVGVAMLAPLVARPLSSALGRPLAAAFGISGRLGRENSMRSPRRTAQTASALMVGLAVVSTMTVFFSSVSKSATASVDDTIDGNFIITSSSNGAGAFSNSVGATAARIPGVSAVNTVYTGQFQAEGGVQGLTAIATRNLAQTVILRVESGSGAPALASGDLLVDDTTARNNHLSVGSTIPVKFAQTGDTTMRVGGIFKTNSLLGSYLVGDGFFLAHFDNPLPVAVVLQTTTGSGAAAKAAVEAGLRAYPNLKIQTRAEFIKTQQQQVNQLLGLVLVLLLLAILIALIGIVNTLLLSVFERTHEIGLLRAVGMVRRQVRAMIRAESVIIAVFGAIVGIVVGTLLGVAFAHSLAQQGISDIGVPVGLLVLFLVIAGFLGLGAAWWPARRAARLDVLAAIASD
ncbi:MAG TPA: FtsX-like permease family protein [Acidimicrobiales bacterium]|nr:FtsX-like permease family protein [Acidimicrobiales bacterium]